MMPLKVTAHSLYEVLLRILRLPYNPAIPTVYDDTQETVYSMGKYAASGQQTDPHSSREDYHEFFLFVMKHLGPLQ